ncbi:MAG TPA: class I SAM-dependent methyltransferase [Candidatus Limnocylindrales bacterium]|nr:class I SAM-dependent methyltransferase [Candidatus Limnocylindrales bacterium]
MTGGAWDEAYQRGGAPWDIGRPQQAIARVIDAGDVTEPVLDSGCGSGEHALMVARMGLQASGVDISQAAIEHARAKARARGLLVDFHVGDVLALPEVERLQPPFRTVIDMGCFHTFANADRPVYAASLAAVTEPGGVLHLLCFSEHTPGEDGPRRVTQAELRQAFSREWIVDSIEAEILNVNASWTGPQPNAWLARIIRR